MPYTLGELAEKLEARLIGDPDTVIHGVGTLTGARAGQISFLTNRRYRRVLQDSAASAVIVSEADAAQSPIPALAVRDPHVAYALVAALFARTADDPQGIHASAVVSSDAELAEGVSVGAHAVIGARAVIGPGSVVGPGCVIEPEVHLGAGCRLVANVSIYAGSRIGARALIHSGAVIGSDGFGFANDAGRWLKVPQLGGVLIGDDVEIGANTTVDRGAIEDTIIEDGVKLDNLIQVAHNVHIGAHTAMAGCVGIAGSTKIGRHCAIGGGVGILGHLEIADGVTVTAMSLVTKSIRESGVYSSGTPLEKNEHWHRNFIRYKQLDEMARRLKALEGEVERLKKG